MKERPILFSASMVCAILEGRKTQTRRIIKEQPLPGCIGTYGVGIPFIRGKNGDVRCPYGTPGDRLWVRETIDGLWGCDAEYKADGKRLVDCIGWDWLHKDRRELPAKVIPSIHMPRWASRINLEVTGVRVERLNEISVEDAKAEGIKRAREPLSYLWNADYPDRGCGTTGDDKEPGPVAAYHHLWTSINGVGSWNENPWVWVVEFKVLENG